MKINKKDSNFIYGMYIVGLFLLGMFVGDKVQGFDIDLVETFFKNISVINILIILMSMQGFILILTFIIMIVKNKYYLEIKEVLISELGITDFMIIGVFILKLFNII